MGYNQGQVTMRIYTAIHTSPSAGPVGYCWLVKQVAGDDKVLPKAYDCILRDLPKDSIPLRKGTIKHAGGMASVDKDWGIVYRVLYGGQDFRKRDYKVFLACGLFKRTPVNDMDMFAVLEEKEFSEVDETGSGRKEIVWTRTLPSLSGSKAASKNAVLASQEEIRLAMSRCLSLPESQAYRLKFTEDTNGWKGELVVGTLAGAPPPTPPIGPINPPIPAPIANPPPTKNKATIASLVLAGCTALAFVYFAWNVSELRKDIDGLRTSISVLQNNSSPKTSTPENKPVTLEFGEIAMPVTPRVRLAIEIDGTPIAPDYDFQLKPSKSQSHELIIKIGDQVLTEINLKETSKTK